MSEDIRRHNLEEKKSTMSKKRNRTEIVFDPDARKQYLQGFSERKRQRRAFGLAMQKVKDRKARLDQRAERKKAVKEQIEQAEQQKEQILESVLAETLESSPSRSTLQPSDPDKGENEEEKKVETYHDEKTKMHWGGEVIVTTSTRIPDESSDDDDEIKPKKVKKLKKHDEEQEFAGNVEKYLSRLKGNMPGKSKKDGGKHKHKGKHGASNMKGMAKSSDLRIAQKALQIASTKRKGEGMKKRRR